MRSIYLDEDDVLPAHTKFLCHVKQNDPNRPESTQEIVDSLKDTLHELCERLQFVERHSAILEQRRVCFIEEIQATKCSSSKGSGTYTPGSTQSAVRTLARPHSAPSLGWANRMQRTFPGWSVACSSPGSVASQTAAAVTAVAGATAALAASLRDCEDSSQSTEASPAAVSTEGPRRVSQTYAGRTSDVADEDAKRGSQARACEHASDAARRTLSRQATDVSTRRSVRRSRSDGNLGRHSRPSTASGISIDLSSVLPLQLPASEEAVKQEEPMAVQITPLAETDGALCRIVSSMMRDAPPAEKTPAGEATPRSPSSMMQFPKSLSWKERHKVSFQSTRNLQQVVEFMESPASSLRSSVDDVTCGSAQRSSVQSSNRMSMASSRMSMASSRGSMASHATSEHCDLYDPAEAARMWAEFRKGTFCSDEAVSVNADSVRGSVASICEIEDTGDDRLSLVSKDPRPSQPEPRLQRPSESSSRSPSASRARMSSAMKAGSPPRRLTLFTKSGSEQLSGG